MTSDIPVQCRCGQVRGMATHMAPQFGTYVICYCDDCQAFAQYLGQPDVMDAHGGTPVFQMAPSRLRITDGVSAIRCVRLSEKGLRRYYADCCKTPIGNTVGPKVPFIGLILAFLGPIPGGRSRDELLGAPLGIMGTYAVGKVPEGVHPKMALSAVPRIAGMLAGWWLTGKGTPWPFLDPRTRGPLAPAKVLTVSERDALRRPAAA